VHRRGNPSSDRCCGPTPPTTRALGYAVPEFVGPVDCYTHTTWAKPSHPPEEDIRVEFVPAGSEPTPKEELIAGIDTYAVRAELVRVVINALAIYSSEPGFMDTVDSISSPTLAVHTAPHDDLVMEEPGPYSAPIPGTIKHA